MHSLGKTNLDLNKDDVCIIHSLTVLCVVALLWDKEADQVTSAGHED